MARPMGIVLFKKYRIHVRSIILIMVIISSFKQSPIFFRCSLTFVRVNASFRSGFKKVWVELFSQVDRAGFEPAASASLGVTHAKAASTLATEPLRVTIHAKLNYRPINVENTNSY
jgi:hypothetical protein